VTGTFRPGRRIACVAVLAAVTAVPLAACAAGYQAETSRERTTLTSVSGAKGALTLRNVFLVGPGSPGGSLPLYLAMFNGGTSNDRLVSVSSPDASSATVPSDTALPAPGQLLYNEGDAAVPQLTGLKVAVLVGQTVPVTLTFAEAGDVTLTVPVEAVSNGLPGPSAIPSPTASAHAAASSGGTAPVRVPATATATATSTATATPTATVTSTATVTP
jgi:copper(I)-binding protein